MEIKMMQGCICDYLGIDDIKEYDMTDEQRMEYFHKICDKIQELRPGWFNYFLQWVVEEFGDCEWDEHACECCGDHIVTYTLKLDE